MPLRRGGRLSKRRNTKNWKTPLRENLISLKMLLMSNHAMMGK